MSANVYLRGSLNDADYTETLTAVTDRLASMRSLRAHVMLMGDLNVEAHRATDHAKHEATTRLVHASSMHSVDLLPPLDALPTHIPWQAGGQQRHLDALAIDDKVRPRIVDCGIDLDVTEPLIPLSDHRPLWVSFTTQTHKVPMPPRPIVFKTSEATAQHWENSRTRLNAFATEWLPQAKHRAACTAKHGRQVLVESLTNEVTGAMHKEYAKGIGTKKVR